MKPTYAVAAAVALILFGATLVHAVIYGEDDRVDLYDAPPAIAQLAVGSCAALVPSGIIDASNPDDVLFSSPLLGEYQNLCDDQRFLNQPTAGWCSGTLIDDDLFLTAGHCIESQSECDDTSFVFGYHMIAEGTLNTITIDDIYACESVVAHEFTPAGDFAIVQVDRPVVGIAPALWSRGGLCEHLLDGDEPLVMIGHPVGLPMKVAGNATVKGGDTAYFELNADTFGGNSGSGVWDPDTLEGTGILVRGVEPDLVYDSMTPFAAAGSSRNAPIPAAIRRPILSRRSCEATCSRTGSRRGVGIIYATRARTSSSARRTARRTAITTSTPTQLTTVLGCPTTCRRTATTTISETPATAIRPIRHSGAGRARSGT
jgi:hypothetical protein